jgi:hypothetical protein
MPGQGLVYLVPAGANCSSPCCALRHLHDHLLSRICSTLRRICAALQHVLLPERSPASGAIADAIAGADACARLTVYVHLLYLAAALHPPSGHLLCASSCSTNVVPHHQEQHQVC